MKLSTHIILTSGLYFMICSFMYYHDVIFTICITLLAVFIGISPDLIDFKLLKGNHRNFLTHSPLSPLFFIMIIFLPLFFFSIQFQHGVLIGILLANSFQLHIFLDMLNPTGVPLIPNHFVRFSKIQYNNILSNMVLDGIGVTLFMIPMLFIL